MSKMVRNCCENYWELVAIAEKVSREALQKPTVYANCGPCKSSTRYWCEEEALANMRLVRPRLWKFGLNGTLAYGSWFIIE